MSFKRYDGEGKRIFSEFTGLPVQPWQYHVVCIIISIIIVGLSLKLLFFLINNL